MVIRLWQSLIQGVIPLDTSQETLMPTDISGALQALYPSFPVSSLPPLPDGFDWIDPPISKLPRARDAARGIDIQFGQADLAIQGQAALFTVITNGEANEGDVVALMTNEWEAVLGLISGYVRWQVGERVALREDLDVFNFPTLPAGTTGTIVGIYNGQHGCNDEIRLDMHVPTLDEWQNVLQICDAEYGEVTRDLFRPA